jgi:hypothetical protein
LPQSPHIPAPSPVRFQFTTPINEFVLNNEAQAETLRSAARIEAKTRKSNAIKAQTTVLAYLWQTPDFPTGELYQSALADGHFVLDAAFLDYMGLMPPYPRLHVFLFNIREWTGVTVGFSIPLSRLMRRDSNPVIMLRLAGISRKKKPTSPKPTSLSDDDDSDYLPVPPPPRVPKSTLLKPTSLSDDDDDYLPVPLPSSNHPLHLLHILVYTLGLRSTLRVRLSTSSKHVRRTSHCLRQSG